MHFRYFRHFRFAPWMALAPLILGSPAQAQQGQAPALPLESSTAPPSVIITGNPLGSALQEMVSPASVLEGTELKLRAQGSLGETLRHLPGVSSTYFGPASSRPIIRGLDGDRIRVMQNGIGNLDASALSFDHAVSIDPIAIDRVEVVRGPAALLYGGNAIGGAVNVLTNRIPEKAIQGIQGTFDTRAGGDASERGAGSSLAAGNGRFALHADGFWRQTSDLSIPGFARSARQRALDAAGGNVDQPFGRVPGTLSRTSGGALGGALTWDDGFAGVSYTNHASNYGSPAERNVRIDLHSDRYDAAAEVRNLPGFITSVKWKAAYTDYVHREIDGGIVGTNFLNRGIETRVEAAHAALGSLRNLKGVFGVQVSGARFAALGPEALVPPTSTQTAALYLYEELPLGRGKLSFGGRIERAAVSARADVTLIDASTGRLRFAADQSSRFAPASASIGLLQPLAQGWSVTANLAHTERAPSFSELYANGAHAATGTYEIGSAGFTAEKSNALDLGVRWSGGTGARAGTGTNAGGSGGSGSAGDTGSGQHGHGGTGTGSSRNHEPTGPHSASLSVYQNRFDNYLTGFTTGRNRDADGTINPAGELREFVYRAAPARFTGFEAEARVRLFEHLYLPGDARLPGDGGTLYLEARADAVRAANLATGEALPRIAPLRTSLALNYALARATWRIEAQHAAAQTRTPAGELPTDGYTLWNASGSYRLSIGTTRVLAWLKATNLGNREARLATSVLRDSVPLGGRALAAGVRIDF